MRIFRKMKKGLSLLFKGDWRELAYRLKVSFGLIDLGFVSTDSLGLDSESANFYSNSGGAELEKILDKLVINANDAILDYGCGKGGALISFYKFNFRKISGVEISSDLVRIAKDNLAKLDVKNIEIFNCDARAHKNIEEYNFFYFYNPFPRDVMAEVLYNIKNSYSIKKRIIHIIYVLPVYHKDVISEGFFVKIGEYNLSRHKCFVYQSVTPT